MSSPGLNERGVARTTSEVPRRSSTHLPNTVRYQLGHCSVALSLSVAYRAPDERREPIANLSEKLIFALTGAAFRLPATLALIYW